MTYLTQLPREVLGLVASMLNAQDVRSFRLVSREINKKTFQAFGDVCFGTVRTDLTLPSIQKLQELCEQPDIIPHINTLLVKDTRGALGHDSQSNWNSKTSALAAPPSPTFTRLCQILKRYTSCRSFRIEDYCPGSYLASFEPRRCNSSDAVAMILAAIAQTSLGANTFSIDLSPRGEGKLDMSRLDESLIKKAEFRKAWAQLEELSLVFTVEADAFSWTTDLITQAASLRRLTLTMDSESSEAFFTHLSKTGGLPKVEKLELKSSRTSKETLLTLLQHFHQSLRNLTLHEMTLESGAWSATLLEMRHAVSRLQTFSASCLNDPSGRLVFPMRTHNANILGSGSITYDLVDEGVIPQAAGVRYQGERINSALEVLAKSAGYHSMALMPGWNRATFSFPGMVSSMRPEQQHIVTQDFNGRNPNELVVKKHDRVIVIRKEIHGWSLVEANGKQGWIPSSYLVEEARTRSS